MRVLPRSYVQKTTGPGLQGAYWLEWMSGSPGAALSSSLPVLLSRLNATTTSGDLRLIIVKLHVTGVRRPLRARSWIQERRKILS